MSSTGASGVLFDLDGTLVDTTYIHTVCWWHACAQFGHIVPMAVLHRAVGMGSDFLIGHVLGPDRDPRHDEEIAAAHAALFATWFELVRPTPGAPGLLQWCRDQRLTVALASSATPRDLEAMLDVLDHPDFDVVTTSQDADRSKPAPDLVAVSLERSGLEPHEAVYVGDSVWDMKAAGGIGMPCVGLTCGGTSSMELLDAGASWVFRDPGQLTEAWTDSGRTARDRPPLDTGRR
jgi:HAD superfamily hydrolase (TIGR01509 family)